VVSLATLSQPRVVGTIDNVGGRLAISDSGILIGSAYSPFGGDNPLGGVRTAALGSLAIIKSVVPPLVRVDSEGNSVEPIEVTYQLIAPPHDATAGTIELQASEGDSTKTVGEYPMQGVGHGTFKVTVPAGARFEAPSEDVEIEVKLPRGETASPFLTSVNNASEVARAAAEAAAQAGDVGLVTATFETLSPRYVLRGSGAVKVTVTGTNLEGLTKVFVRSPDGRWRGFDSSAHNPTSLTFTLPMEVVGSAGFLQISPVVDTRPSLAFLVAQLGLPAVGSASNSAVSLTDPYELSLGAESLTVIGSGMAQGTSVVLGLGGIPGLVLPTTYVDETEVQATLPSGFLGRADDLFVAVQNSLGLSASVSLPSKYPDLALDLGEWFEEQEEVGERPAPMVTNISADLVWNKSNQEIQIEGVGLTAGLEVVFNTSRGTYRSYLQPAVAPPTAGALKQWVARVPDAAIAHAYHYFFAKVYAASSPPLQSAPAPAAPATIFKIPFGGRGRFLAYADSPTNPTKLILVHEDGRGVRQIRPFGRDLKDRIHFVTGATFGILSNPTKPSGLTVVQKELDSSDAQALHLRGTGVTSPGSPAVIQASLGALLSQPAGVTVVKKALGNPARARNHPMRDREIIEVADAYGISPQHLKSQALEESGAYRSNFRYESLTRDHLYMTGDDPQGVTSPHGTRWIETEPLNLYAVGGRMLAAPTPNRRTRTLTVSDSPDGVHFGLGEPVMRRYRLPRKPVGDRVTATIAGIDPPKTLELALDYPIWRKIGPRHKDQRLGELEQARTLGPNNFSIQYSTGQVRLGRALRQGETLTISFDAPGPDTTQPVQPGQSGFNDYDLMGVDGRGERVVRDDTPHEYRLGETLLEWFVKNLRGSVSREQGYWLTGNKSERLLEFTVTPAGLPDRPLDTRYSAMTAQPYASAAYGPLQVQLDHWAGRKVERDALNTVLDAGKQPVFPVLTDFKLGLEVGAVLHQLQYRNRPGGICNPCTEKQWYDKWAAILHEWNRNGPAYAAGGKIEAEAWQYAPDWSPRRPKTAP
jgi:hypothetical protein